MTTTQVPPSHAGQGSAGLGRPLAGFVELHRTSLVILPALLVVVGVVHVLNMQGWPGRVNDDEGTYVAQAWAVLYQGRLAHYTYAYDHPPLGWLLIAGYAKLTGGFVRTESALMVGREVMLIANLASCALLYVLARRMQLRRWSAVLAVLLFSLSPLAVYFHRLVFLDNLAVTLVLAALVFAASPRRSLAAAVGTGLCFGCAVLTKETAAVLFPVVIWVLVQNTDRRTRHWNLSVAGCVMFGIGFFYPLYSILKNELFPGPGHVSLIGAVTWQLLSRPGTGSLLDPQSGTSGLVRAWLDLDAWVLLGATALLPLAFVVRELRPVTLALLLQILLMFRGGYTPYPHVIALLPFAALLIAGLTDRASRGPFAHQRPDGRWRILPRRLVPQLLVAAAAFVFAVGAIPAWGRTVQVATTEDLNQPALDATAWIAANVDRDAVIIVDDYLWPDLALRGFTRQVWTYKADLDPEVKTTLLPNGWASADYVALDIRAATTLKELSTVVAALENSTVVATFGRGDVVVRKVDKPGSSANVGGDDRPAEAGTR